MCTSAYTRNIKFYKYKVSISSSRQYSNMLHTKTCAAVLCETPSAPTGTAHPLDQLWTESLGTQAVARDCRSFGPSR